MEFDWMARSLTLRCMADVFWSQKAASVWRSCRAWLCIASLALTQTACRTTSPSKARHTDPRLQRAIEQVVNGFEGDVGVYVHHLRSGRTAAVRADDIFPTASMVKVPILCGVFEAIEQGKFKYTETLTYSEKLKYDDGVTGGFRDGKTIPLAEVVVLMITLSDNTASLWLQGLVGGTNINAWLAANGFPQTRVNSRTPGREAAQKEFGWGQTTPREMADLLTLIGQGGAVSPAASEEMFRVLSKPYWDKEALSQLPPDVHVAQKSGAVNASKSEVVWVSAPSGPYVFCLITNNQKDQRWADDNAGYVVARRLSRLLWGYFERQSPWQPKPESGKWSK
jgi:beta-lactamase class A